MTTTITWTISQLDCLPQSAEGPDFVVTAHWQCVGVDGAYTSSVYSTCAFTQEANADGTFTPYEDLTQDQVLGWCWENGVDKAATEAAVQQQIDNQINPPLVVLPLPWSSAPQTA
jgi:hypothetical protein